MELNLQHLPIIDWELGAKLVGNKKEAARDMIAILIKSLPSEIATIKKLQTDKNHSKLLTCVHKLHGAVCYCGTPRLKIVIASLETELKNNIMISSTHFEQLYNEAGLLLEQYSLSL